MKKIVKNKGKFLPISPLWKGYIRNLKIAQLHLEIDSIVEFEKISEKQSESEKQPKTTTFNTHGHYSG